MSIVSILKVLIRVDLQTSEEVQDLLGKASANSNCTCSGWW